MTEDTDYKDINIEDLRIFFEKNNIPYDPINSSSRSGELKPAIAFCPIPASDHTLPYIEPLVGHIESRSLEEYANYVVEQWGSDHE